MNFLRNKYDPCVYNRKNEDGTVTTIKTHVDDLKVSSKSSEPLQNVVKELKDIYQEITVHESDTHDYLGMIMIYNKVRKCMKMNMEKYIEGILSGFRDDDPDKKVKPVSTPATNNLFETRETVKLSKRRAGIFHTIVAKLLFVAKRARPDILLAVSFLTTRVKEPDTDDRKKVLCVLGYLGETLKYHFTLHCSDIKKLTWYIDGSYASHSDMRGQSGAVLVAGGCSVLFRSNKQKVNTRSSTETELIAVDDVLPTVQWTKHFMRDQGYDLETEIREDNQSTILLMKNGRLLSGKRTKHLDIRYLNK
jgi:hypothetical protein